MLSYALKKKIKFIYFCLLLVTSKEMFPIQGYEYLLLYFIFLSKNVLVLALVYRSLIHFILHFVCGVKGGSKFIFLHVDIFLFVPFQQICLIL